MHDGQSILNEPVAPPVPTPDGGPADIAIGDLEAFTGKGRTLRADALPPPAQEQAGLGRTRSGYS